MELPVQVGTGSRPPGAGVIVCDFRPAVNISDRGWYDCTPQSGKRLKNESRPNMAQFVHVVISAVCLFRFTKESTCTVHANVTRIKVLHNSCQRTASVQQRSAQDCCGAVLQTTLCVHQTYAFRRNLSVPAGYMWCRGERRTTRPNGAAPDGPCGERDPRKEPRNPPHTHGPQESNSRRGR